MTRLWSLRDCVNMACISSCFFALSFAVSLPLNQQPNIGLFLHTQYATINGRWVLGKSFLDLIGALVWIVLVRTAR